MAIGARRPRRQARLGATAGLLPASLPVLGTQGAETEQAGQLAFILVVLSRSVAGRTHQLDGLLRRRFIGGSRCGSADLDASLDKPCKEFANQRSPSEGSEADCAGLPACSSRSHHKRWDFLGAPAACHRVARPIRLQPVPCRCMTADHHIVLILAPELCPRAAHPPCGDACVTLACWQSRRDLGACTTWGHH